MRCKWAIVFLLGAACWAQLVVKRTAIIVPNTAVPTLVQWSSGSSTKANAVGTTVNGCATQKTCFYLPNGAQGANVVVFAFQYSNTPASTPTCSNDKGDTCTVQVTANDTTNAVKIGIARVLNVTAGARQFVVAFGAAVTKVAPFGIAEFYNVATSSADDGNVVGTSGSGSSTVTAGTSASGIFAGSGTSGDLLIQCGARTQTPQVTTNPAWTVGSQSNITWQFLSTDSLDGLACQYGVYTSTSSISPAFTMASNSGYATAAIALKAASAGSAAPAGMRIVGIQHEDITNTIAGTSPILLQVPVAGNLVVGNYNMDHTTTYNITGITDGSSNTWVGSTATANTQIWCANAATPNNALTLSVAGANTGASNKVGTLLIYDIAGASSSACPARNVAPHLYLNTAQTGTSYTPWIKFVPGGDDAIVIGNISEAQNTTQSISSPSSVCGIDSFIFGGENLDGGGTFPPDENNGWWNCHLVNNNEQAYTLGTASNATINRTQGTMASFLSSTATPSYTLASDSFTRANQVLQDQTGCGTVCYQTWAPEFGRVGDDIVSNSAVPHDFSTDGGSIYSGATFSANQWAQATITAISGGSLGAGPGLFTRADYLAARTEYRFIVSANTGNNTVIEKFVADTHTNINTACAKGSAWAAGNAVYVQSLGPFHQVRLTNATGTIVCNGADTSVTSGNPGVAYSSTSTTGGLDHFTGGIFNSVPTQVASFVTNSNGSGAPTVSMTTVTAGHQVVVLGLMASASTTASCADDKGSTYTSAVIDSSSASGFKAFECHTFNVLTGGTVVVTITLQSSVKGVYFAQEWTGLSSVDQAATFKSQTTSTTWTWNAMTTAPAANNAGALFALGGNATNTCTFTAGAGYLIPTNGSSSANTQCGMVEHMYQTAGAYTPTATLGATRTAELMVVSFK